MEKLTKKDLEETKWDLNFEESKILQMVAFNLGFKMTSCWVGLWDKMEDLCNKTIFDTKINDYKLLEPPYDCCILYFEKDTFSGCNLSDEWDNDYEDYKEMKFEDIAELNKLLLLNKL